MLVCFRKEGRLERRKKETKKSGRKETKMEEKLVERNRKEKTIQEEIDEAYQAWCIAADKDADLKCTAVQNDEPLQGMLSTIAI